MWSSLDDLYPDDDIIETIKVEKYNCDSCNEKCFFPFYHLSSEASANSIDLCRPCFSGNIHMSIKPSNFYMKCLFCKKMSRGVSIIRVEFSLINIFICSVCKKKAAEDTERFLKKKFTLIDKNFGFVNRKKALLLNLSPAGERYYANKVGIKPEHVEIWISLVEDLIKIPRSFGSFKNWCVFSDEYGLLGIKDLSIFFIINTFDGRIGAVVSEATCHARVYIIFQCVEIYKYQVDCWKKRFKTLKVEDHKFILFKLNELCDKKDYYEALRNFIGYRTPGICSIFHLLSNK